jgi:hypothetical protein
MDGTAEIDRRMLIALLVGIIVAGLVLALVSRDSSDDTASAAPTAASSTGQAHEHDAAAGGGASTVAVDLNGHEVHGVKAHDVAAESQPDEPLDAPTRALLRDQLTAARAVAMRYPTAADATAAGYHLIAGFGPGSGAHYIGFGGYGTFDPSKPPTLIYDGTSPTSQIVGLMYLGGGETAPEGFAGPNDHWHRHSNVCTTFGPKGIDVPFAPDTDVTRAQCKEVGGNFMQTTTWMVHAWVVPGWDSPAGVFSHENPNLRCADGTYHTDKVGKCQGS